MIREIRSGPKWWGRTVSARGGTRVEMIGGEGRGLRGQGRGLVAWAGLRVAGARVGWMGVTDLLPQGDLSALQGGFFRLSERLGPCLTESSL